MITFESYKSLLGRRGNNLSEVRKNSSDIIMNATFVDDIGYKKVYILDPNEGWKYTDAHYSKHSAANITRDAVDYYLQFRPKEHYPIGTYVFIPDDTSSTLDINEERPFDGDVSHLWFIVGRDDVKQFVRYNVLKVNWNFKWVVGHGDAKRLLNCWGAVRDAKSYTSGIWHDYRAYALDSITSSWVPNTYYIYGDNLSKYGLCDTRTISLQMRMMITHNDLNPNCFMVSKLIDTTPAGLIKITYKLDDFNPKRDNVQLRVCDYYNDSGDIILDDDSPLAPDEQVIIRNMIVNNNGELEESNSFPTLSIGTTYYYSVSGLPDGQWRITLNNPTDETERVELERMMVIREIADNQISLRPGKSNRLKGREFTLSVIDIDGVSKNSITIGVEE